MNFGRGGFQVLYLDFQWPIDFNRRLYVKDLGKRLGVPKHGFLLLH